MPGAINNDTPAAAFKPAIALELSCLLEYSRKAPKKENL